MRKLLIIFLLLISTCSFGQAVLSGSKGWDGAPDIGIAGAKGFGVGVCPPANLPTELVELTGTRDTSSDNYGNYMVTADSSIMVFIPIFYYKIWSNNSVFIKGYRDYGMDTARARLDSFAVHRAFIDGGKLVVGFFVDKYSWSLTNVTWSGSTQLTGIASSRYMANPISSLSSSKRVIDGTKDTYAGSFSNCISNSQSPTDDCLGAWSAAKSRGSNFAVTSMYVESCLALLSLAHGQASTSTTNCGWYHATNNFPKGNNNYGADYNDATCTFTTCDDGYWLSRNEARKTGSANTFNKSTHNGQNCGVSDMNGNQWTVSQGLTTLNVTSKNITAISKEAEAIFTINTHGYATNDVIHIQGSLSVAEWDNLISYKFFKVTKVDDNSFKLRYPETDAFVNTSALVSDYTSGYNCTKGTFMTFKESLAIKDVTGANHFNSTYITNNFDAVSLFFVYGYAPRFGNSTNQVLSGDATRTNNAYMLSGLGLPMSNLAVSGSGSNSFGQDYYYEWIADSLCPLRRGYWNRSSSAGVWCLLLSQSSDYSDMNMSGRSCLYSINNN
jgi:hypothetical protein